MTNHEFFLNQKLGEMRRTMTAVQNQVRLANTVKDQQMAKLHLEEAERLLRAAQTEV